jgi:hypothetical protein
MASVWPTHATLGGHDHGGRAAFSTVTSAVLGDPRGDEAEKHTSGNDSNCESDETEP